MLLKLLTSNLVCEVLSFYKSALFTFQSYLNSHSYIFQASIFQIGINTCQNVYHFVFCRKFMLKILWPVLD